MTKWIQSMCAFSTSSVMFLIKISFLLGNDHDKSGKNHFEFFKDYWFLFTSTLISLIFIIIVCYNNDRIVFETKLKKAKTSCKYIGINILRLIFRIIDITLRMFSCVLLWFSLGPLFLCALLFIEFILILYVSAKFERKRTSNTLRFKSKLFSFYNNSEAITRSDSDAERVFTSDDLEKIAKEYHSKKNMTKDANSKNNKKKRMCKRALVTSRDYLHAFVSIKISFSPEDGGSFARTFSLYRFIYNLLAMITITIASYIRIHCDVCHHKTAYNESLIEQSDFNFVIFIYCWVCVVLLPVLFVYLANNFITDGYDSRRITDIVIKGDIIGICELLEFGIYTDSPVFAIQFCACHTKWDQINEDTMLQYFAIMEDYKIHPNTIKNPYSENEFEGNLLTLLCENINDITIWTEYLLRQKNMIHHPTFDAYFLINRTCELGNINVFNKIIKDYVGIGVLDKTKARKELLITEYEVY